MNPKTVLRLACLTRKYKRYENPIAYRLCRKLVKWVCPKKRGEVNLVVKYDRGLLNVNTKSAVERSVLFHGDFQPGVAQMIRRTVKGGDVCLDIGANVGVYTLLMAYAAGPTGKVIAVEPHPKIAERLRTNLALNRLTNVCVLEAAVSNSDGRSTLYIPSDTEYNLGRSSLKPQVHAPNPIEVRTVCGRTLEQELSLPSCNIVKIDVEGADLVVLKELSGLIVRYRPYVILEYSRVLWGQFGSDIQEAFDLFGEWTYKTYYIKHEIVRPFEGNVPETCDLLCVPPSA